MIEYLSPTSIGIFVKNPETFYLQYLSVNKPPRDPQLQVMSIGSAFDAYCKSYIHEKLFGKNHTDSDKFAFETIFTSQVESHNHKWAREHGKYAFEQYRSSGALADLMLELESARSTRFEFEVRGVVNGYREGNTATIHGVTLLGKPDASYVSKNGVHVILDWKVNGYLSKASPAPGYVRMRGAGRTDYGKHKDAFPMWEEGILVNVAHTLEQVKSDWADQLSIYAWLCGESVGSNFIVGVDQLVCDSFGKSLPSIRIAQHRLRVSEAYQHGLFNKICEIWEIVHSDHFFRGMSKEDSIERCKMLDNQSSIVSDDEIFNALTRRVR